MQASIFLWMTQSLGSFSKVSVVPIRPSNFLTGTPQTTDKLSATWAPQTNGGGRSYLWLDSMHRSPDWGNMIGWSGHGAQPMGIKELCNYRNEFDETEIWEEIKSRKLTNSAGLFWKITNTSVVDLQRSWSDFTKIQWLEIITLKSYMIKLG